MMRQELFPISIFKAPVLDNQRLKDLLIPYVEQTRQELTPPQYWLTNKIVTSYENKEVEKELLYGDQLSTELKLQYMLVLESFFERDWSINLGSIWYNYYANGEYQEAHTHVGSFASPIHFACVHFLSYDSEIHSPLVLKDPLETIRATSLELRSANYQQKYSLEAKEGDLVMFPSYLYHEVKAGLPTPDYPRITVSFNIQVTRYSK